MEGCRRQRGVNLGEQSLSSSFFPFFNNQHCDSFENFRYGSNGLGAVIIVEALLSAGPSTWPSS